MHPLNTIKPSLKYRRIQRLGQGNFADVILVEDIQAKQVKSLNQTDQKFELLKHS